MIIVLLIIIIMNIATIGISIFLLINNNKMNKKITSMQSNDLPIKFNLSFEECDKYIDNIIDDIWKNKYFINYRLRDLTIIPGMDNEIKNLTEDIILSIGSPIMTEILKFYSHEYIIRKITRKAQMLFIDYTNTYKPNTK